MNISSAGLITANAGADIKGEARSGSHATPVGLYVTGNIGQSSGGIEFRHSNGTQGVGFGYNSVYATGSSTNQDLNFYARGSGIIYAQNALTANAGITYAGVLTTASTSTNGARIAIQGTTDGGNTRGIFIWEYNDPNWGIYMATSGSGKALNGGTAPTGASITSHCVRFRAYDTTNNGFVWENSSNTMVMSLNANQGNLWCKGTVTAPSDRRKKEDIKECLGLDFINKLNPVCYRMIDNNKKQRAGLIAQEVEDLLSEIDRLDFAGLSKEPVMVQCPKQKAECELKGTSACPYTYKCVETGDYEYGIGYSEFIAPLIKAVQQLSEKVVNLEKENKTLLNILQDQANQLAEIRVAVLDNVKQ